MELETFCTVRQDRREKLDPRSLARGVRQLLADKISGNLVGLWRLAPEHLRLGTGDLLTRWAGASPSDLSARLALQLVHEAARGVVPLRTTRTLTPKGFELLNGLPFVAADQSVHDLLEAHTVQPAEALQLARFASAIFRGIDGDIRIRDNTVLVTLYNAPHPDLLKPHYENLPQILEREHVDPRIPWLYNFKLDFRFR